MLRRRPWRPLLVGAALLTLFVWGGPLLWLALNFSSLSAQEPGAASLFAAAPRVHLTGQAVKVSGPPGVPWGRYLLREDRQLDGVLARFGWVHAEQFGAARIYARGTRRLDAVCRQFSRSFSVCVVAPP